MFRLVDDKPLIQLTISTGWVVGVATYCSALQDENVSKEGDLYIRSVCFSPDGKYLATGAEDKQIRVS